MCSQECLGKPKCLNVFFLMKFSHVWIRGAVLVEYISFDWYANAKKGSPITIDVKTCDKTTELTNRFISTPNVLDLKGQEWESSVDKPMIQLLQRYLNVVEHTTQ